MMNKKIVNGLCLALTLGPFSAFAEKTITLSYENVDSYPFAMVDGSGIDLILLKMVDEALPEVAFKYETTPWQRCLHNIETAVSEGCFTASFKEERLKHGFYPGTQAGGAVDPALRLHASSYSLYVPAGSNIEVSEKLSITNLKGKIAVPTGYSIGDDLAKAGYAVDEQSAKTHSNFKKLLAGRVDAVAALTLNGDNILEKDAALKGKIVKVETPLVDKPYYLMFSKQFYSANPELAEKIWNTAAQLRESPEFADAAGAFLAK
jgi:polar amino acid transport system substrate-binding protein